jgi:hypothetical protein
MSKIAVILAAAGKSTRFGDPFTNKVFATIVGKPLWMYAAEKFSGRPDVGQVLIAISPEDKELFNEKYAGNAAMLGIQAVLGGAQRADSVRNALQEGHRPIALVGGATGMIGDPSGKSEERNLLSSGKSEERVSTRCGRMSRAWKRRCECCWISIRGDDGASWSTTSTGCASFATSISA